MHMVQIRNLPDELFWMLSDAAKKQHRSLGQQAIALMADALGSGRPQRRRKVIAELRADQGKKESWKRLSSSVDLIREDRDR